MRKTNSLSFFQQVLWFIVGVGVAVAFFRFWRGLGGATNLDDVTPWGLGIVFDVACGIALAAGGFTLAAVVYIFQIERYKPIARLAVLSACLGYGLYCVGLAFDMGRPERFWHILIYWQHHSVLFEVAWCVILYMTVLFLEFTPVLCEGLGWRKIESFFKAITMPVVIAGVALSTLHQSSLGALFLIMKGKLDDLWHTQMLPFFFLLSAISAGVMIVTLLGIASAKHWKRKFGPDEFAPLARTVSFILFAYFILKMIDLVWRGQFSRLFEGSFNSYLFLDEMIYAVVLPAVLFSFRSIRRSTLGVGIVGWIIILGVVFNRMNVGLIATFWATGSTYFPTWMEIAYSTMLVSLSVIIFSAIVRYFPVFGDNEDSHNYQKMGSLDELITSNMLPGQPGYQALSQISLVILLGMAVAAFAMPSVAVHGRRILSSPARPSIERVFYDENGTYVYQEAPEILTINCDRMGKDVKNFPHQKLIELLGGDDSCLKCHCGAEQGITIHSKTDHRSCALCHTDMYRANAESGAIGLKEAYHIRCIECHDEEGPKRNLDMMSECQYCHR
ncbi:MAG: Ni/Fe-hydrogenase cytochrome b subunit [Candidatus Omnitrophota bacterium]|jgi:Ni/Fe-hydrogenase subunit HybB-like protein|nr:MAG: Ni/Fe-hydrogenase cytochrome b subunit [Candidatus Omnitrophota bacterium]